MRPLRRRSSPCSAQILRLQNILTSFDDFAGNEILTERQSQDYRSVYLDLYAEFRRDQNADKESINDDVVFEIELIKQVEINVDYILMLVQKYRDARGDGEDMEIRANISRAIDSSPTLRNKKDLIEDFVDSVSATGEIDDEWRAYVAARREAELNEIIEAENLRPEETRAFIDDGLPRRRDPDDWHRDHQGATARIPVLGQRWARREEAARAHQAQRLLRAVLWAERQRGQRWVTSSSSASTTG